MSNEKIEVRPLPKKTIYIIVGLIVLGALAFFAISASKQAKMAEVLADLGYKGARSITIYNESPVENEDTKRRGTLTKLKFYDAIKNQECFGFVHKDTKTGKYTQDLDCK